MRADARSNGGIIIHHGKMHLPVPPRPPAAMPVPAVQWLPEEPRQQAWAQTGQPSSLHVLLMPQDIQENWTSCPCHRPSACRGARTGEASYGCSTDMPWGRAPSSRVQCCLCSTVVRLPPFQELKLPGRLQRMQVGCTTSLQCCTVYCGASPCQMPEQGCVVDSACSLTSGQEWSWLDGHHQA